MTLQIERIGSQFHVVLTAEQMAELGLSEGATVELRTSEPGEVARPVVRYATAEQVMQAFEETRPRYDDVYHALAK